VFEVGTKHQNMAAAAINVIRSRAKAAPAKGVGKEKMSIESAEITRIAEALDKYNVRKIFGV
jgi:ribosomal protein L19E